MAVALDVPVSDTDVPAPLVPGVIEPEIVNVGTVWIVKLTFAALAPEIVGEALAGVNVKPVFAGVTV